MRVVTLGEVMLRLCPEEFLRINQSIPGRLEATFGGGEVNVAVSIVRQGGTAAFATLLPDNPITDAFERELRKWGVDAGLVRRTKAGRFGIYFVEAGANQRGARSPTTGTAARSPWGASRISIGTRCSPEPRGSISRGSPPPWGSRLRRWRWQPCERRGRGG